MTSADIAWRAFVLLSGPFLGTYLATLAVAWPRAPFPIVGGSVCARCGTPVPALAQVPLISWLARRGRRRCCGGAIPRAYPLGEAFGLVAGLLATFLPTMAGGLLFFATVLTLAYVALVDLRRFSIPLAGLGLLALLVGADLFRAGAIEAAAPRLGAGLAVMLVFELLRRLGRGGMGFGDVLLAGVLGVLVDWRAAPVVIAVAAILPLLVQVVTRRRGPVPFGFWLCLCAVPAAMLRAMAG